MAVSSKMTEYYKRGSAIRKMFDEGLLLKARHGDKEVVDLSIGNPLFPPPEGFRKALLQEAEESSLHGYMPNAGYPYVRERVAEFLNENDFFEQIGSGHIVMTTGASGALNITLKTILDPGDEVIVLRPYFVEYGFYIDNHGGTMVLVDTDSTFGLDLEKIDAAISDRTRAIILNSPNNPSGRMYSRDSLDALASLLRSKSRRMGKPIFLLSDEPYRDIVFSPDTFVSPATVYENSFLCYSWSKSFSVPGERIGYLAVNPKCETANGEDLMGTLAMSNRILGYINAPAFMQHVIAASIDAKPDVDHYRDKLEKLSEALVRGEYRFQEPEGTFYLFPETPGPEADFIQRAKENLLLVVPGSAFGRQGYFRICFACPDDVVDRACEKLLELSPIHQRSHA